MVQVKHFTGNRFTMEFVLICFSRKWHMEVFSLDHTQLVKLHVPGLVRRRYSVSRKPFGTPSVPQSAYFYGNRVFSSKGNKVGYAGLIPMRKSCSVSDPEIGF